MILRRDHTNKRFGHLRVLLPHPKLLGIWVCRCDCGFVRHVASGSLTRKRKPTISCGCITRRPNRTHGQTKAPMYRVWTSMISRCYCKTHSSYKYYGAKGVTVCEKWRNSYTEFLNDVGERPKNLTLDRINNSLGYQPGNVRWVTPREQNRNLSTNVWITINGQTLCMKDMCEKYKICKETIKYRARKSGRSFQDVFEAALIDNFSV